MDYNVNQRSFPSLREWGSPQAFDAERHIKDLVAHPGWVLILGLVAEGRDDVVRHLTAGLLEHAQMARLSGIAEGLQAPQQAVNAVLAKAEWWREQIEADTEQLTGREQEA